MAIQKSNFQCYEPKPNHLTDGNGTNKNKLFVKVVPLFEINHVFSQSLNEWKVIFLRVAVESR